MLKINASFSKKVPVPGEDYSSQSYHASIECEVSDALTPVQIQERVHATFDMVKSAVEAELAGKPAAKSEPAAQTAKPEPAKPDTAKASNKQIKFILDLAKGKGLTLTALNARVQDKFRVESVYELARKDASRLVDELKAAA